MGFITPYDQALFVMGVPYMGVGRPAMTPRWWFQNILYMFFYLIQFDEDFSDGLNPPPA